jgi:hypothetical protein
MCHAYETGRHREAYARELLSAPAVHRTVDRPQDAFLTAAAITDGISGHELRTFDAQDAGFLPD